MMPYNIPKFEQMEPLSVLPQQPVTDREIFYPTWHCFCCHDTGLVQTYLVYLVMPKYKPDRDKWVICQNPGCCAFSDRWIVDLENFDSRFKPAICQKLDRFSRQDWQETVKRQIDLKALAKSKAMPGTRERTENDKREVNQRKQEAEAFDWAGALKTYSEVE